MSARRDTELHGFGRPVGWEQLPVLGTDSRHARRGQSIRRVIVALVLFWGGLALAWFL